MRGTAAPAVDGSRSGVGIPLGPGAEFRLVRAFVEAAAAPSPGLAGPGDDAAALEVPAGEKLVATTDASAEGIHFRREWMRWDAVGHRATAAALSDLAAMAARPLGVLVTLLLPPELEEDVVSALGLGVGACLREEEAPLLGGDVSRSPGPVIVDVTALGSAARPVTRAGARPGQGLWVTGELGGAAAALWDLSRSLEPDPRARRRLERPRPRIREARWLAGRAELGAMIDLSDGLAGDARHVAAASGVELEIDLDALPLAPGLRGYAEREAALRLALAGGEDFELLIAAPPGALEGMAAELEEAFGTALTRVGRVVEGEGVSWTSGGRPARLELSGHDHFGPRAAREEGRARRDGEAAGDGGRRGQKPPDGGEGRRA